MYKSDNIISRFSEGKNQKILIDVFTNLCDKNVGTSFITQILNTIKTNTNKYEIVFLFGEDIQQEQIDENKLKTGLLSFMVIEKGECEENPEIVTLHLICANKVCKCGNILFMLYIYTVCYHHFENGKTEIGLLELAAADINVEGLCLYSKYMFSKNTEYVKSCFSDQFNVPMEFNAERFVKKYNGNNNVPQMEKVVSVLREIRDGGLKIEKPTVCNFRPVNSENTFLDTDVLMLQKIYGMLANLKRILSLGKKLKSFEYLDVFETEKMRVNYLEMISMFYPQNTVNSFTRETCNKITEMECPEDEEKSTKWAYVYRNNDKIIEKIDNVMELTINLSNGRTNYDDSYRNLFIYFYDNVFTLIPKNKSTERNERAERINKYGLPLDENNCWYNLLFPNAKSVSPVATVNSESANNNELVQRQNISHKKPQQLKNTLTNANYMAMKSSMPNVAKKLTSRRGGKQKRTKKRKNKKKIIKL